MDGGMVLVEYTARIGAMEEWSDGLVKNWIMGMMYGMLSHLTIQPSIHYFNNST